MWIRKSSFRGSRLARPRMYSLWTHANVERCNVAKHGTVILLVRRKKRQHTNGHKRQLLIHKSA